MTRGWWHRHGVVRGAFVANQFQQQGLGGVSGNDDAAVHATAQQAGAGSEAEVAAMIRAAVAAIAMVLEDRLNALRVEGDGRRSRLCLRCDTAWLPKDSGCRQREGNDAAGKRKAEGVKPISAKLVVSHESNPRNAFNVTGWRWIAQAGKIAFSKYQVWWWFG